MNDEIIGKDIRYKLKMSHDPTDLKNRTKIYALRILKMYQALPDNSEAKVLGKQFLRSGTSSGAQYREACRAKSPADFINKMEGSLQELDETGSNYLLKARFCQPSGLSIYKKKMMN